MAITLPNTNRAVTSGAAGTIIKENLTPVTTLGSALVRTASTVFDNVTEYQKSSAGIEFLKSEAEHKRLIGKEGDDDYETYESRYVEGLTNRISEIGSGILDPSARADFNDEMSLRVEQARGVMNDRSWGRERDINRALVKGNEDNLSEVILNSDDPEEIRRASELQRRNREAAMAAGYFSAEENETDIDQWQIKVAVNKWQSLPTELRSSALKQPYMVNLPSEIKNELKEELRVETRKARATAIADKIMRKPESALSVLRGIGDDKLRREAETRWNFVSAQVQRERILEYQTAFDKYAYDVLRGDVDVTTIEDQDSDAWDALGGDGQVRLFNMAPKPTKPVKVGTDGFMGLKDSIVAGKTTIADAEDQEVWGRLTFAEKIALRKEERSVPKPDVDKTNPVFDQLSLLIVDNNFSSDFIKAQYSESWNRLKDSDKEKLILKSKSLPKPVKVATDGFLELKDSIVAGKTTIADAEDQELWERLTPPERTALRKEERSVPKPDADKTNPVFNDMALTITSGAESIEMLQEQHPDEWRNLSSADREKLYIRARQVKSRHTQSYNDYALQIERGEMTTADIERVDTVAWDNMRYDEQVELARRESKPGTAGSLTGDGLRMSMRLEALISSEQYVDALKLLHSREFNDNVGDKEIIKYNRRILDMSKPDAEPTVTVDTSISNIATMVYAATRGTIPKGIREQELIDFANNLASNYPVTPTVKQFQSDIRKHIAQVATDTTLGFKSDKKSISEVPDWRDLSLDSTAGEIRNDVVTYMKSKGITRPLGDENREEFNRLASELAVRRSRKNVVE